MRGTQTIGHAAFAGACFCVLVGCLPERKRRQSSHAELAERIASVDAQASPPLPPAVVETLRSVHEQKLEITPPASPLQRLEFGSGRLLQALKDNVVFRETKQGNAVAEANVGAVRAVAHGPDGSLFALGSSGGTRLEPRSTAPKGFPHVAFFPGSLLFGDLEEPSHFYVYYAQEQQLAWYSFPTAAGSFLPIDAKFAVEGCVGALGLLRDGAFVCRTASGLLRKAPRGRRVDFKLPVGCAEPFRLLPAKRLDELFSVLRSGEVVQLRLGAGTPVIGRFQLPATPFAAAANAEALAFLTVGRPDPGQPRVWALLVTDFQGQVRFRAELPATAASADERWLQALVEDKNLAISEFEPLVAVGGPAHVAVWNYAEGRQVFAR